jgi:hypothetical protein
MPRPSEPKMNDVTDKDVHRREGVDPYPVPKKAETATRGDGDTTDPAKTDPGAPHDRGTASDGGYTTGTDAMKNKLDEEGVRDAWKHGRTQEAPETKH